jgi:protein-disulfide isomerase
MGCLTVLLIVLGAMIFGWESASVVPVDVTQPPVINSYADIPQTRTEDGAFILGYPEAAITIVAFEDFLCPHCQNYEPEIQEFIREYVVTRQARFEFRMLPISQLSSVSFGLAECAEELEPGSFWKAHDVLFQIASARQFDESSPRQFAQQMGMSADELLECIKTADQYQIDSALAGQYGEVTGTPSVGWRLHDGELRFDGINRRPSVDELGDFIAANSP